jgi:hypothetical protein
VVRRYRRRRKNNLASVVSDVADIASKLPWWGAFLTGLIAYLIIAHGLAGFIEGRLDSLEGNPFSMAADARLSFMIRGCEWVGRACFFVGLWFTFRNSVVQINAYRLRLLS